MTSLANPESEPRGAVYEFLRGLIDYAGLFPPADLDLDTAIRTYARDQHSPDAWMLATFICPAGRLGELAPYAPSDSEFRLRVSALAPRVADAASFADAWEATRLAIAEFESIHGNLVSVDAVEIAIPEDLFTRCGESGSPGRSEADALTEWIQGATLRERAEAPATPEKTLFFEPPLRDSWKSDIPELIRALTQANRTAMPGHRYGFKFRCGGVIASAFPSPAQLACAIFTTAEHDIPFKATAGLHHPLRHYNESVQTRMHGFLNVFGACLLARARGLSEDGIALLLADEDPRHFVLSEDCFCWKDHAVTGREIALLRKNVVSYGSCSFDEPREDLRKLRIL